MQKFENMDVIAALEAIMHQNTAYYQSDFAYDIKMLREAARSDQPEDKLLLWLSGTGCAAQRHPSLQHMEILRRADPRQDSCLCSGADRRSQRNRARQSV